ncbi:CatA-like O-acetyltransferase [Cyanobium sp. CH-040]|uniref:CatA-like O-acetyltransferase n=1 Tax=Cyanobium sp. CH-040 TaxID=2823708 RepID=UPI0020CDC6EB|nr:CatA-like O-acetyltransferase [Cyanobium sp. CH-040]MCP9927758.1 hypothetical protein [Cyanobium sp. CH-040]
MPVFSISSQIDISGFGEFIAARDLCFYTTLCCLICRSINASSCFRHRIGDALHCGSFAEAWITVISTGRSFRSKGAELLPIAVQAHHALVDGAHVARMLEHLCQFCRHPQEVVG